jgi:dUTP pyrophosphatase
MKIQLIREVTPPLRSTPRSAGIDFFVPNDFSPVTLFHGEDVLIPSGVKIHLPENYSMLAVNKSGIATKLGLIIGACLIDEDYEGEIHLHVIKATKGRADVVPGMKLTQMVLLPTYYVQPMIVTEIGNRNTERGAGGFGSTGQ